MIDNRTVGKTIATLRQAKGMTQQQLAAAMNVSHQAVSKWENGAALPDIQTLVELTQLFGVTVEQLLNGEIPEARLESESGFDEHMRNIGNFVNGVIDDIGNMFKPAPEDAKGTEDAADSPAEETEKPDDSDGNGQNDHKMKIDLDELLTMAPFMSKSALSEMLEKCGQKLSATDIARLAPFLDADCLERLIRESGMEINWNTLRRIAPFLRKEAVDAFARMIAMGEKYVRPVSGEVNRVAGDVCRTLDDMSRKIEKGVDRAVRKVVAFGENVATEVSKAFDGLNEEPESREERLAKLRRSAFERAMEDGRWDWIEAHIAEVKDEELRRRISEAANRAGKQEWVYRNMGGYADAETIEKAISDENWDWLGEHAGQFIAERQRQVAQAAVRAENWTWLSEHAEQLDLGDEALEIALRARRAGERMLAVQLARYDLRDEQLDQLVIDALAARDMEFIDMAEDLLPKEMFLWCCTRMAKMGDWESVRQLSRKLDGDVLEQLMEIAIDEGDFDAVDMLDALMNRTDVKEEQP